MARKADHEAEHGVAAPYIAFQSLKTMSKDMKEHGVPSRIDRSVLGNFSGSVGKQIVTALKFLGLTDADGHTNATMKALVDSYDTDAWPKTLADIIRKAYDPLFRLNLETASPAQFSEKFCAAYPGADAVQRKQSTFFLNAARDAQIKISPYIMKNKKPRSGPPKKRASKSSDTKQHAIQDNNLKANGSTETSNRKLSEQVLAILDDPELDNEIAAAVLKLLPYLRKKGD